VLLIFDWDGTLSDSTERITLAMQRAADEVGLGPLSAERVRNIIGLGLPEALLKLYPDTDDLARGQLRDAYRHHFSLLDHQPSALFPGVLETLEHLGNQGHRLAIATSKSRQGLDRILAGLGLGDLFEASRCADETASKPHPLMLQQLLTQFHVGVDEAVMVGDTEYDMEMARCIQMPRIAVSYGAHAIERLKPYEPIMCVDDFVQLLQWDALS
jgi:phosphoglycolate phosphatase